MRRGLLPFVLVLVSLVWSCQPDETLTETVAVEEGLSAAGGNGNGNAYGLQRNCSAMDVLEHKLQQNPGLAKKLERIEAHTRSFINAKNGNGGGKPGSGDGGGTTPTPYEGVVTIPVVVHVIYNTPEQNISDAQIQSQMAVLDKDFSATNPDAANAPDEFASLVANSEVQFELAGITRKASSRTEWGTRDDMKYTSKGGQDAWDAGQYLNIWVCNIGGGILGYAQFPGGDPATDGVVISPQFVGDAGYVQAPFDKGRTATHEVGHWLNLRHIWGDGQCRMDDYVADTPSSNTANYGCPAYPTVNCRTNDMTMNYMDYVDDHCMYMFSLGQKDRMRALFATGGARESFVLN